MDHPQPLDMPISLTASVADNIILAPSSRQILKVELEHIFASESTDGLSPMTCLGQKRRTVVFDPNRNANIPHAVLVGRCICDVQDDNTIMCEFLNIGNDPVRLYARTRVGRVYTLVDYIHRDTYVDPLNVPLSQSLYASEHEGADKSDDLGPRESDTQMYDDDIQICEDTWPKLAVHYDDDYPNVCLKNTCLNEEQLADFREFLKENRKAFANRSDELTQTNIACHTIDTKDAVPIRMPCYKTNPIGK